MAEQVREVNQLPKDIYHPPMLGGFATAQSLTGGGLANDPLFPGDGVDQMDGMVVKQPGQLALKCREVAGLNFDQQVAPDDIDDEVVYANFEAIA